MFKRLLHARNLYFFLLSLRSFASRNFSLGVSLCCLAIYLWLTHGLLQKLQEQIAEKSALYVERIEMGLSGDMHGRISRARIAAIIDNDDLPVIVIDTAGEPIAWTHLRESPFFFGAGIADTDMTSATRSLVKARAARFMRSHKTVPIRYDNGGVLAGYLCTGASSAIRSLSLFSFCMAALFVGFILFTYVTSYNMRVNERSNLWVALAKETAHQLGTPITALMGWVEYLRSTREAESGLSPAELIGQIEKICTDMESDILRLRKISSRFSQIGSVPVHSPCDINDILNDCMDYYRVRLPLLRRKIDIRRQFGDIPPINANRELLEWVFENLLKNSVDAIQHDAGRIEIRTEFLPHDMIARVYHADNGKGITWEAHKKIFSPGYTTKKRGWGLGLTLAKRIIEDYHQGRIYVQWSKKNKGTVMCVELPIHAGHDRSRKLNV